ncbi:zinc-dependent peptidase [Spongiivirga citrea]|uniref:Zinc-dependent peptidase n=1 Tax=Spongiivirga citrea TaxID=1481457 RepID=A0A6M0CKY0_9FLAO|nr:zinc-dependent peptidase [Spongiivirga citrea]NER18302.1 hypothetical protein [Spongiivirga citrea]
MEISAVSWLIGASIVLISPLFLERIYIRIFNKPFFVHFPYTPEVLPKRWKIFIAQNSLFYSKLTASEKRFFDYRLKRFIKNHRFIGNNIEMSHDKKVLIATIPVMLTFGMRGYLYDSVDSIIVNPDEYFSNITEKYHKGEHNPAARVVVLSWKDFKKGIEIIDDNRNLGVHEFTHALFFSCKINETISCQLFARQFTNLLQTLAQPEIKDRVIKLGYFRDYAFENQYEFLSVVFECFFETPQEFKQKLPELYDRVRLMLNLDMAKIYNRHN